MRIRSLQTYLSSQNLVSTGPIELLEGLRIGTDAAHWLRGLDTLKDPMADAIGGLPPTAFSVLKNNIDLLDKHKIKMLFVFQGIQPSSHRMFTPQMSKQVKQLNSLIVMLFIMSFKKIVKFL